MTLDSMELDMTPAELERLRTFDSSLFGQLDLNSPEAASKRSFLIKGVQYLENELIRCNKTNSPVSSSLLCSLGHIHLLLEDYAKSLSAYQRYYNCEPDSWKNAKFLYGLGVVYSYFSQPQWATQAFQQCLYTEPNFSCAGDIHLRLGIFLKNNTDWEGASKNFKLALNDSSTSVLLRSEVRFHLAHMQELQGNHQQAKSLYESVLQSGNLAAPVRANICRQLGWLYHTAEVLGDTKQREPIAIDYLKKSIEADPSSGQSWYYLGRCYSTIGQVHDAFVSYRQSIDKSEASADTWCSIGILYQQQSQPMDALQAYICAVQLEKTHVSAWTNLGLLYESVSQFKDALHCYQNAHKSGHKSCSPGVVSRVKILQGQLNKLTPQALQEALASRQQGLPSIEEAFHLPIPAELTSRQQQGAIAAQAQVYHVASDSMAVANQHGPNQPSPKKRRTSSKKKQTADKPDATPPPFYLSQQQIQTLYYLQAHQANLTSQQQQQLHQLRQHYFMQQQHMISQQQQQQQDSSEPTQNLADRAMQVDSVQPKPIVEESKPADIPATPYPLPTPALTLCQPPADLANISLTSLQILESCRGRGKDGVRGSPNICSVSCRPPAPPPRPEPLLLPDQLSPAVPTFTIENKKDALSADLKRFCMAQPIVVVKGLSTTLRLNLALFSTKSLVETAPDHTCEVRTQRKFNLDETLDQQGNRTWKQESTRNFSTIARYAQYQASSFQESLKEETMKAQKKAPSVVSDSDSNSSGGMSLGKKKQPMMIRFGTNVDLSDKEKWREQLVELQKLPPWLRVHWAGNALSHLEHTVLGMNSVQLYMKIPGCRTPGHQENLNFCSININIGPGECEWYAVPEEYWGVLQQLCEKQGVNYLSGAWWPLPEHLREARVPLYQFTQKPGDLVWISAGTVHWVQATGWCNNVAWNVAPLDARVFHLAVERYEYNKLQGYKSIIPMVHLAWNLARNIKLSDPQLFNQIKFIMMKSLEHTGLITDLVESKNKSIDWHGHQDGEAPHYCFGCDFEVFNILFVREVEKKHVVYCLDCALKSSPNLDGFVVLREHKTDDLARVYDAYELASNGNTDNNALS